MSNTGFNNPTAVYSGADAVLVGINRNDDFPIMISTRNVGERLGAERFGVDCVFHEEAAVMLAEKLLQAAAIVRQMRQAGSIGGFDVENGVDTRPTVSALITSILRDIDDA